MSRRTNYHYDDVDDGDESITELHSKVKLLKDVSIRIDKMLKIGDSIKSDC